MSKSALVIPAHQRFVSMDQWTPELVSRDICETDPTWLQILPYVVLLSETSEIFMYTRGAAGQESRLHSKRSVGLGGHVDTLPPVGTTMRDHLANETIRELEEEVGYSPSREDVLFAIDNFVPIYSTQSDVDSVHLGMALLLRVDKQKLTKLEEGTIVNPQWLTLNEMQAYVFMERMLKPQCLLWTMEGWSKTVAGLLTVPGSIEKYRNDWEATALRFFFYTDIVNAMLEAGVNARVNAVKGLAIEAALWKTEEGDGEGFVQWDLDYDRPWSKIYKTIEGYVISDETGVGEVMVTRDFVLWENRDASTLHPMTAE